MNDKPYQTNSNTTHTNASSRRKVLSNLLMHIPVHTSRIGSDTAATIRHILSASHHHLWLRTHTTTTTDTAFQSTLHTTHQRPEVINLTSKRLWTQQMPSEESDHLSSSHANQTHHHATVCKLMPTDMATITAMHISIHRDY